MKITEPIFPPQCSANKGKRKTDPTEDLNKARNLRQKQDEEDAIMTRIEKQRRIMLERKKAREAKIQRLTDEKAPKDSVAFYERELRPNLRLESVGEEEEEDGAEL
ncbi:hypothetical protein K458DRAFT_391300 [Lentithecium fluviatile CBS 122367]|uniref:Uncharacterized protein n=1 Tax=Lentithecium fluviatile CBS 122367 TaxID=1168545 RepID=A0A6G1IVJ7_9PLEO|nr:hypothetical protein K458DRAFT_391300 [Lentithecium fluviatile CBS 122367]